MDTPDVSQLDEDDCIAVLSDCGLSVKLTVSLLCDTFAIKLNYYKINSEFIIENT